MENTEKTAQSNLDSTIQPKDVRDLFVVTFTTYHLSENYKIIYKEDPEFAIPKRLIELYYDFINPDYNNMIYSFKKKYISNEILVEKNDTKEQRKGLSDVYQYIQDYDCNKKPLNLFINALEINQILWKPTDTMNSQSLKKEVEKLRAEADKLKKESKLERNLQKYQKAQEIEKEINTMSYKTKIGGQLRSDNNNDEVHLNGVDIKVPTPAESLIIMNGYLNAEKRKEFSDIIKSDNIIEYISYCVKETTKLIKTQPFFDGNKRTFRALLNLMFKAKGLPPVYVKTTERETYKNALYSAMKEEDYSKIIGFYLFKICDSIYELDIDPYRQKMMQEPSNPGFSRKRIPEEDE